MKVQKADAVKLFVALGFKAAVKWDDKKLTTQLNNMEAIVEEEGMDGVQNNAEQKKLLTTICKKLKNEEEIELEVGKVKAAKPADEDEEGAETGGEGGDEEDGEKKKGKKAKKEKGPKAPGVISSIIEFLGKASAKKPLSKSDLADKLAERFPDKEKTSMASTINVQVPNRIRKDKGIEVSKNENGYWIDPSELSKLKD